MDRKILIRSLLSVLVFSVFVFLAVGSNDEDSSDKTARKKTSYSKASSLVKKTFKDKWKYVYSFEEAPLQGGTAVLINGTAAFWVKDGKVYALNGLAKNVSDSIEYGPVGMDIDEVEDAIRPYR